MKRTKNWSGWIAVLGTACGVVYMFWPPPIQPVRFWDTYEYLLWPKPLVQDGVTLMGARPVGYAATLAVVGSGVALAHLQTWISVCSWSTLGWTVGRVPGLVFALLLAYSTPVRLWNLIALTESLSISLAVLLIAITTILVRRWDWRWYGAWVSVAVWFVSIRDANLILLPFFMVPLRACGRRRFLAALVPIACVAAATLWQANRETRWKPGYQTAIMTRVIVDSSARREFEAAGMPHRPFREDRIAFLDWLGTTGRGFYTSWFLRQPDSYRRPWDYFFRGGDAFGLPTTDLVEHFGKKFFAKLQAYRGAAAALADSVFRLLAAPVVVGMSFVLVPLVEWRWRGSVGLASQWVALLTIGVFVHGFAAYNLSGSDHSRHLLLSSVLYRVIPLFLGVAVADMWRGSRNP